MYFCLNIRSCANFIDKIYFRFFLILSAVCFSNRIMFGSSHLYVFYHPTEAKELKEKGQLIEVSYEMAQEEIAKNAGFKMKKKEQSQGTQIIHVMYIFLVLII